MFSYYLIKYFNDMDLRYEYEYVLKFTIPFENHRMPT